MKALIVKEDGLIYVNEVPEEPHCLINFITNLDYPRQHREYLEALASAKDSAILCADQEKAIGILMLHVDHLINKRPALKPGIYPIEGLEFEKCVSEAWFKGVWTPVAIIKQELEAEEIPCVTNCGKPICADKCTYPAWGAVVKEDPISYIKELISAVENNKADYSILEKGRKIVFNAEN